MDAITWRQLADSKQLTLEVISGSMYPLLKIGDKIIVSPLKGLPKNGEITVFYRPNESHELVVHRCLGGLLFSGDHTMVLDRGITEQDLVGVVHEFERDGEIIHLELKRFPFKVLSIRLRRIFSLPTRALKKLWRLIS